MGMEFDVYSAAAPNGTKVATLTDAVDKKCLVSLHDNGVGSFAIPRSSAQATASIIRQGNYVKVRLTEVSPNPIFGFWMDTGRFDLVSSGEEGSEMLAFGGQGSRAYLRRAIMWSSTFISGELGPTAGVWNLHTGSTGSRAGAIIERVLREAQAGGRPQQPIPDLTYDFTAGRESREPPGKIFQGDYWADTPLTGSWKVDVGTYLDEVISGLVAAASPMVVQVGPALDMSAWNEFGVNRTTGSFVAGKVRLEKGVNIATALTREIADSRRRTHALVGGDPGYYGTAEVFDPYSFRDPDRTGRNAVETFVSGSGTNTSVLSELGAANLAERQRSTDSVRLGVPYGLDSLDGIYLPRYHYWVGDTITLHTGRSAFDYTESSQRIVEIALGEDEGGGVLAEVTLGSPYSGRLLANIRDAIKGVDRR